LRGLTVKPVVGTAVFVDDNGPRGGGVRCALTLRLPYRPALRAERTATTPRLAFDGAVAEEELGQLEALGVAAPGTKAKRRLDIASAHPTARHPASSAILNHFRRQGKHRIAEACLASPLRCCCLRSLRGRLRHSP